METVLLYKEYQELTKISVKMDEDFEPESVPKESFLKRRRRTSLFGRNNNDNQSNGSAVQDSNGSLFESSATRQVSSRPRRLATWGEDTNNDIQQLRSIQSNDFSAKSNKQKLMDSADDDVTPMIPDLEEVKDYEMSQQVAEPPSAHNQIISFQELDKNLLKQSAFVSLDGIDLTALTHFCLPESRVKEPDIPWSWDNLMSDVMSKVVSDTKSEDLKF